MLIQFAAAEAAAPAAGNSNPYGLFAALHQGGALAWSVFLILVFMSVFSFYIMFTKLFEQQKIINQGKRVRATFWTHPSLKDASGKLEKNTAYKQLVDDGLRAQDEHHLLTDPVDQHDWTMAQLSNTQSMIRSKLQSGLPFLATVGATAPFIGLFGTVIGIYRALIKIGAAGQASIDTVAGPVGEALIMTALGLAVAVPAVLAYNWLQARNKAIAEHLTGFAQDVHGYMASGGSVKPVVVGRAGVKPAVAATSRPVGTTTAGQTGGVQTKPGAGV
ncbi:MAG: MotA/TolQ/ExbB proton channel family protein [Sphingomonadaceae bacterium]|nr:MotA/TolQ/ExbB proton channel family protein [Sphingomonadaceae bacterium]